MSGKTSSMEHQGVMKKHNSWLVLFVLGGIVVCGFYLRNGSIHGTKVTYPVSRDAQEYFMYAFNFRHKHTYSRDVATPDNLKSPVISDAVRSPGYPLFLTLFVDGLPHDKMIKQIVFSQMIISTLTILVAFFFFRSFLSDFWGAAAALLVALSPHLIVINSYLLSETFFCFLVVVAAWLVSVFVSKPSKGLAIIIGGTLGAASLVRPSLQYFPAAMAIFLIFQYGWKKGAHFFLPMLLGFALILSPWVLRNLLTLNTSGNKRLMINFLHHGIYPDFMYNEVQESFGFPYQYDPHSNHIGKDIPSVLGEIERRFHLEPMKHFKWYLLKKPLSFWSWDIVQGFGDVFVYSVSASPYFTNFFFKGTHRLMHAFHRQIVFLALLGSLFAWLPPSSTVLPEKMILIARFTSILLFYFTILHMIGAPFPRYSVPLRPFLYGMAMFPFHFLKVHVKSMRGAFP
jgi:4-amino-4-deoxy-L-arabinose transferase-like glycosyltransferase